jgi:hypothetical protein
MRPLRSIPVLAVFQLTLMASAHAVPVTFVDVQTAPTPPVIESPTTPPAGGSGPNVSDGTSNTTTLPQAPSTVPEPTTLGLFALGLGILALRRRRT